MTGQSEGRFLNVNKLDSVVVTADEVRNTFKFFEYFHMTMPEYLKDAIENFAANVNVDTQDVFRCALVRSLVESKDDIMQDPLMQAIKPNLDEYLFHYFFDKQAEEFCSTTKESV